MAESAVRAVSTIMIIGEETSPTAGLQVFQIKALLIILLSKHLQEKVVEAWRTLERICVAVLEKSRAYRADQVNESIVVSFEGVGFVLTSK